MVIALTSKSEAESPCPSPALACAAATTVLSDEESTWHNSRGQ